VQPAFLLLILALAFGFIPGCRQYGSSLNEICTGCEMFTEGNLILSCLIFGLYCIMIWLKQSYYLSHGVMGWFRIQFQFQLCTIQLVLSSMTY
jgi:hypothetical protein